MGAAECVQGYRVCAGCSFNILPCSTRLNQKIFYWKKKYFIWMCIKNKNYMENWLFWGLNLGNLKQCMMIMLVLTSSSSAWTLCSLLHISSLINICNFYSFWATGMVLTSKWGRILQEIHCQCQLPKIWLICPFAGRKPANFHKRNYLLSVNTTDFEKTTIQAHSAMEAMVTCLYCVGARSGRHQATASADIRGHWRLYETIQTFSHSSILTQHSTAGTGQHSHLRRSPSNNRQFYPEIC